MIRLQDLDEHGRLPRPTAWVELEVATLLRLRRWFVLGLLLVIVLAAR